MKELKGYKCDVCGKTFWENMYLNPESAKRDCEECELSHVGVESIVDWIYCSNNGKYPKGITVKFKDGSEAEYTYNSVQF